MARLVTNDLPLEQIANDSERSVVNALLRLPDSWFIIPNLRLLAYRVERELDIVLLHPAKGVVLVEVKGFIPEVRRGVWFDQSGEPKDSPFSQAIKNSYVLRDRLRAILGDQAMDYIPSAVAFPHAQDFDGSLPDDRSWFHVLLGPDLASIDLLGEKLDALVSSAQLVDGLGVDAVNAIIGELAPDAKFVWDAEGEHRRAREMLRTLSEQQIEGFASLDANRQVFVRGRAGTGKTGLARSWVKRAVSDRGERVLLTCYNDPLGWSFAEQFAGVDGVTAGPFLRLLLKLPGVSSLPEPGPGASASEVTVWWEQTLPEHVAAHLGDRAPGSGFDTIVIDEAQDFAHRWIEIARLLLDPAGPQRLLMLGDEAQDIRQIGFTPPSFDDGWVVAELPRNCRNADVIATLLRRRLNGAKPSPAAPPGWSCRFIEATLPGTVNAVIAELLTGYNMTKRRDPASIGVVAIGSKLRDAVSREHGLPTDPDGKTTCVGTPHRLKGLEFDTVILVIDDSVPEDVELYIGVSRAISELVIVGPAAVAARLGLPHSSL